MYSLFVIQLLARLTGQKLSVSNIKLTGLVALVKNLPMISHRKRKAKVFSTACHFKHAGFAVVRSSWRTNASYIFMKLDGYGGDIHMLTFSSSILSGNDASL